MAEPHEEQADERARQGTVFDDSDPKRLRQGLELAFDYRGDVTITLKGDGGSIEGYVYDRRVAASPQECRIRILPADGGPRRTLRYDEIAEVRFSGRDTAAGRSFDTWMRKYVQKKLSGQEASIKSEPLDGRR